MYQRLSPHSLAKWSALAAIAAGLVAGCRTEPAAAGRTPATATNAIDSCASNMHELSGCLLQYYVVNHTLPERLTDLQPMVDFDKKLPLACPLNGKAYLYFRDGLIAASEPKRLLVVEPEPIHNGGQWGIVTLPAQGNTPLGLWVVHLSPTAVQQFHTP